MKIFSIEKTDGIAIVTMNDPQQSQNVLNEGIQSEFSQVIDEIERDTSLKGLIFTSSKPDCFVAGADIDMLSKIETAEQATQMCMDLHGMFGRLENLSIPTVAAIHGACLGGGLELALLFDHRVASTAKSTKIGLPEVQLGLLPGGGGTQRVSRMLDLPTALDLLLTGKQLNAKRALKIGLVDEAVSEAMLLEVAHSLIEKGGKRKKKSLKEQLMNSAPARKIILSQAEKKMLKATKGKYPAPKKILEVVEQGLATDLKSGLEIEAKGFGELVATPESKQLINIFFAVTDLKKDTGVDKEVQTMPVEQVGVLGAGLMGAGIATVTANNAAKRVRLKDLSDEGVANGIGYVGKYLDKRVQRKRMKKNMRDRVLARVTGTTNYEGLADSDIVIEAVFESLDLKRQMVADIESIASDKRTLFATNTSAIPIDDIAANAKHPERVVGMHYFSPVEKMPLLEIVRGSQTADWVTATAVELGKKQGKTVIVVADGPGFYTTRILVPYNMEAVRLVLEGVAIEEVDRALEDFGFPVGPIKLMDEVGIDVGSHIVENLNQAFGDRIPMIEGMDKVIDDDRKGRKNKRGFYNYSEKSKGKEVDESVYALMGIDSPGSNKLPREQIASRVVLTMLNEAAWCLQENILRGARDGDIGAIFGLGFPPFLGGPFRYMDSLGIENVVQQLGELASVHGERFKPAPILLEMVNKKSRFYS